MYIPKHPRWCSWPSTLSSRQSLSVPIFLIARKTLDLRTAKIAAWVWAFFPYAINFSATTMWYHSFVALLLAVIFLLVLSLRSSDRLTAWAGFGVFSALRH